MWWTYRTELRNSPLRWALPVFVALDLAALFGRATYWIGIWSETSAAIQIPAFYLGPAMAGAAAWTAARRRRDNSGQWMDAAARPLVRVELAQFLATLTYGVAAYAIGAATAVAVTAPEGGPSLWWPGYALLGLSLIVLCAAFGHLVGRSTHSPLALPLIAALGCFVALGLFGQVPQGPEWGLGFAVLSGYPDVTVMALPLAARVCFAAALATVAVAVGGRLRSAAGRPGWPGVPVPGLCALALLAASGVLLANTLPLLQNRPAPEKPLCTSSEPRICMWPESAKYLPEAETMSQRLSQLPQGLFTRPAVFHETGTDPQGDDGNGFYVREGEMWELATGLALRTYDSSAAPYCDAVSDQASDARQVATWEVIVWLTAYLTDGPKPETVHGGAGAFIDEPAIFELIDEPKETQYAWVAERLRTVRETPCD